MPNDLNDHSCTEPGLSAIARERLLSLPGEPLFVADWVNVLMIHCEVDRDRLRPAVPFELDLREGRAFVSLVAFRLSGMRARWMPRKVSRLFGVEDFLNVRTYVKHRGETGIYFLAEWVSRPLSVILGPRLFGLPYREGKLNYENDQETADSGRAVKGEVKEVRGAGRFAYTAELAPGPGCRCESGSLEEWLMERYTAFTCHGKRKRFFRVWHQPWQQKRARLESFDPGLLQKNWPFFDQAEVVGANFSPGVFDVWMGWPHSEDVLISDTTSGFGTRGQDKRVPAGTRGWLGSKTDRENGE